MKRFWTSRQFEVVSAAEVSFSAMVTVVKRMLTSVLKAGGNPIVFVSFTLLSIATSIVQDVFSEEMEFVKIKLKTKREYQNVEYTQHGLTAYVLSWVVVDKTITMHAS